MSWTDITDGFYSWKRTLSVRSRKSRLSNEKINRFSWCYRGKQDYWVGEGLAVEIITEYCWITEKEYMLLLLMRNNER